MSMTKQEIDFGDEDAVLAAVAADLDFLRRELLGAGRSALLANVS
jgi:hypothetical protein